MKRFLFDIVLLGVVFFAPWWLMVAVSVLGIFYFSNYYEVIAVGLLFDILYGTTGSFLGGYGALGFFVAFALFVIVERVKKELR